MELGPIQHLVIHTDTLIPRPYNDSLFQSLIAVNPFTKIDS